MGGITDAGTSGGSFFGEVATAVAESPRGTCLGTGCADMGWLISETIKRDYPADLLPEEVTQATIDETDYAFRECIRDGICLAKSKREADAAPKTSPDWETIPSLHYGTETEE
jgi:hypothetical protein